MTLEVAIRRGKNEQINTCCSTRAPWLIHFRTDGGQQKFYTREHDRTMKAGKMGWKWEETSNRKWRKSCWLLINLGLDCFRSRNQTVITICHPLVVITSRVHCYRLLSSPSCSSPSSFFIVSNSDKRHQTNQYFPTFLILFLLLYICLKVHFQLENKLKIIWLVRSLAPAFATSLVGH